MNIATWFSKRTAEDPEYARAAALVDLTESLADVVVGLRIRAGLSQAAAAALAGTTQATISLIENGDANPRADTITRVLNALMARAFAADPVMPELSGATADWPIVAFDVPADLSFGSAGASVESAFNSSPWLDVGSRAPRSFAA